MAAGDSKKRRGREVRLKQNPLASIAHSGPFGGLQAKFAEVSSKGKAWVERQSAPVEIAVVTVTQSLQGAALGGLMGTLTGDIAQNVQGADIPKDKMEGMKALAGGPWVQARNFAVMTGVNQGLATAMKRYRKGKDDIFSSVVPAFGSGAAYSIVAGLGADQPGGKVGSAVSSGVGFAIFQGAMYKISQRFSPKPQNDLEYLHTKSVLQELGLERYEKNFKRGQLSDRTLPLLTDSALKDAQIPPGPRLLILEAVHRRRQTSAPKRPTVKTVVNG